MKNRTLVITRSTVRALSGDQLVAIVGGATVPTDGCRSNNGCGNRTTNSATTQKQD